VGADVSTDFANGVRHDLAELVERCMNDDPRATEIIFSLLESEASEPQMLVGPAPRRENQ
jgi:hypothetical protein